MSALSAWWPVNSHGGEQRAECRLLRGPFVFRTWCGNVERLWQVCRHSLGRCFFCTFTTVQGPTGLQIEVIFVFCLQALVMGDRRRRYVFFAKDNQ